MCNVRKSPDKITEYISVNKKEHVATSVVAIIVRTTVLQWEAGGVLQRENQV
jgi:hypothetical protein